MSQTNVYGEPLIPCCTDPMTGYFRDGTCRTAQQDTGTHVVCAIMTEEFLKYTASQGNDLITPLPLYNFPGLKPGDGWCLCVLRWEQARKAGVAPPVKLKATAIQALKYVELADLEAHAYNESHV